MHKLCLQVSDAKKKRAAKKGKPLQTEPSAAENGVEGVSAGLSHVAIEDTDRSCTGDCCPTTFDQKMLV